MDITKDDIDVLISRMDDRFDKLERMAELMMEKLSDKKIIKGEKLFYDNVDLMEITGLSYRIIQDYRLAGELHTVPGNRKNFYTEKEVHRFIKEVLPRGKHWLKRKRL